MAVQPHLISLDYAMSLLKEGLSLTDSHVQGIIDTKNSHRWVNPVTIDNCIIEDFESVTCFEKPLEFINSHFIHCSFVFSYFLQGLKICNSTFDKYLDFQSGGHNRIGYPIIIDGNTFSGFVKFFDCWYTGEVSICNNKFNKGTNIESKGQLITFDLIPVISNNSGETKLETDFLE